MFLILFEVIPDYINFCVFKQILPCSNCACLPTERATMNTCRLCLYQGDDKQVLSVWDCHVENLAAKIRNCVSVNITRDDELPTSACLSCIHQVTQWVVFKETCEKSNDILVSSYSQKESCLQSTNHTQRNESQNETLRKSRREVNHQKYKLEPDSDKEDKPDDTLHFKTEYYDIVYKIDLPESIYKCNICSQEFDNCFNYLDHQHFHDGQSAFHCDKCPKIFDRRIDLVDHDRNHRRACPQCGKMILKSSMKLHLIKHTDRHMCMQCSGRFNSRAALAQHIITVHTDIKDHICETCGKRFSSQTAMRVHMKSHSDERLYSCKLCSYAGRTASALYVHMSTHANDLCVCEVCSKTFKSGRNLNDHLRRVHSKVKKHECSYCKKKFVDKYMLRVHVRCHTGVRPYQCTKCDKAFIRSDGLKEHLATHGQRVMYDCKECGKKFTSKRGVTRHTCTSIT